MRKSSTKEDAMDKDAVMANGADEDDVDKMMLQQEMVRK